MPGVRAQELGYSLIELLIGLGIVALVLSVVASNYRDPAVSFEVRALAVRLAAELRSARATAIGQSRDRAFVLNADERWYQVDGRERSFLPASIGVVLVTARTYVRGREDARLVFFSDGSSTGGKITIQAGNQAHSITVDWLTGAVRVDERAQ